MSYAFNRPPADYTVGIMEFNPDTKETDVDQFEFFGTVDLEGSFAILKFIEKEEITQIMIVPSHILVAIDWKKDQAKVIKLQAHENDSDTAA